MKDDSIVMIWEKSVWREIWEENKGNMITYGTVTSNNKINKLKNKKSHVQRQNKYLSKLFMRSSY